MANETVIIHRGSSAWRRLSKQSVPSFDVVDHQKSSFSELWPGHCPATSSALKAPIIRRSSFHRTFTWRIMPKWGMRSTKGRRSSAQESVVLRTAAGRCSRCVPVATVGSATAVKRAASRYAGHNYGRQIAVINGVSKAGRPIVVANGNIESVWRSQA
jgi:hypothetical protein